MTPQATRCVSRLVFGAVLIGGFAASAAAADGDSMPYPESFFTTVEGVRLHGRQFGAAVTGEPPIVLVHGLGGHSAVWNPIVYDLAKRHRVYTLDLKGFGYSDAPRDADYALTTQMRLLWQWMRAQEMRRVVLVGQSMGAYLTHLTAMHHPESVAVAVMFSGAIAPSPVSGGAIQRWLLSFAGDTRLQRLAEMIFGRWTVETMYAYTVVDPRLLTPERIDEMYAPYRKDGAVAALLGSAHRLLAEPPSELLAPRKLEMPAYLVWGDRDRIAPREIGQAAARFDPSIHWIDLAHAGHNTFWDLPQAGIDVIERAMTATNPTPRPN